jgi:hypothetical protein
VRSAVPDRGWGLRGGPLDQTQLARCVWPHGPIWLIWRARLRLDLAPQLERHAVGHRKAPVEAALDGHAGLAEQGPGGHVGAK